MCSYLSSLERHPPRLLYHHSQVFFCSLKCCEELLSPMCRMLYLCLEVYKISLGPFSHCIHTLPKSSSTLQSIVCLPDLLSSTNLMRAYVIPLARSLVQELNCICPSIDPEENLIVILTEWLGCWSSKSFLCCVVHPPSLYLCDVTMRLLWNTAMKALLKLT